YPPSGFYVAETVELRDLWNTDHLKKVRWHDKREPKRFARLLQPHLLQLNIPADESCLVRDKDSGVLVCGVIRGFCPVSSVLPEAVETTEINLALRKSVRVRDPGCINLAGYTAGSRSGLAFDLTKNLRSKKHSPEATAELHAGMSSLFALFWNMSKARLPREVISDIEGFLFDTNINRMDGGLQTADGQTGEYKVSVADKTFAFTAELAPPSGVFAGNYSRAIHYENQPHKYSMGWCLSKEHAPARGGNFYLANYGIRVEQAANTVIVWRPNEWHGTSLHEAEFCERPEEWVSVGLCIVTSSRIRSAWEKFQRHTISREELIRRMEKGDEIYGDEQR
ncbi:hypothetical protein BDN72DRAFT_779438, partial [Pluteus cervinus]